MEAMSAAFQGGVASANGSIDVCHQFFVAFPCGPDWVCVAAPEDLQ